MSAAASIDAIEDVEQRRLALDVGQSFVVQAPAGSGKTGLLVQRFLALLARVERPEAVLAITFTRKAAGEMRRRIIDALRDAEESRMPPVDDFARQSRELASAVLARDAALGWQLLRSPSRLQVFTIDSYCSRIVSGTPLLSRLGSTPRVVEHPNALYREAARRTLSSEGRAGLAEPLEVLLERYEMGLDRLEAQLVAMLSRRDQWLEGVSEHSDDEAAWVARIEAAMTKALAAEVAEVAAGLDDGFFDRIHDVAVRSRAQPDAQPEDWPTLGATHFLGPRIESAPAWKQAAALLAKKGELRTPRSNSDDVHGGDPTTKALLDGLLEEIAGLPEAHGKAWRRALKRSTKLASSPRFGEEGRAALGAFLAVLRHAAATLWLVFREHREVDFAQVALAAVDALRPGETLENLDARIEHILVDEFQDTSVLQCGLLRGLTSGWQHGDGRTLFLVGDPMQSIYRFRKAEVGLFLSARRDADFLATCPLTSLGLVVNFRSTRSIVGWVNGAFSTLLGDHDDAARSLVAFASASTRPRAAEGIAVDFVMWDSPSLPRDADADAVEAAGLADWIAADARERRTRGAASAGHAPIAVLVRGRSHALPLLRALESRAPDVRLRAPGLDMLGDRGVAQDLEALTRAIVHPGDRLSWLAVLHSPQVGLPFSDLALLVEPSVAATSARRATAIPLLLRDREALSRVGDDSRRRIARLLGILDAARAELATRSIDSVVRTAWLRLGGLASPSQTTGTAALDADAFFDLLASHARGGSVDLDDLAAALADTEAAVDLDADADVEIMTMHKAKGLEFDTVILPALGRGTGGNDGMPLAMETNAKTGLLAMVAPREARGRNDEDGDKYVFLQHREKRRGDNERLRVLYVAATRAKHRLILSAAHGRLSKKTGKPHVASLLAALEPALPLTSARIAMVADPPAGVRAPSLRLGVEPALASVPAGIVDRSVSSAAPSALAEVTPKFFSHSRKSAHIGTVYHAFVQRIAGDGPDAWPPARVTAERTVIAHALRSAGVLPVELDDAVARVSAALVATLEDADGRWLLAAHDDARSEWAMLAYTDRDRRLTSAAVDRSFVENGTRWIVDFKTGRPGEPTEDDETLVPAADPVDAVRRQYAPQLARYRDLVRGRCGDDLPVRAVLYFAEWPSGRLQDVTGLLDQMAANPEHAASNLAR